LSASEQVTRACSAEKVVIMPICGEFSWTNLLIENFLDRNLKPVDPNPNPMVHTNK
jgi:hypothetical protein